MPDTLRLLRILLMGLTLVLSSPWVSAEPPAILLAEAYRSQIDVTKYLVSEKLDGVRAIWDGQTLRFRSGRTISAPRWFVEGLPKRPLDGELWMGRGSFERLSGIVRRAIPDDADWRHVRYMIFELPDAPGTFVERVLQMRETVKQANVPWLKEIAQFQIADGHSLHQRLNEIVKAGGEGLMLHRADALYQTGRSDTLLKLKPWADAEAVVIGFQAGKGKFQGQLGALRVRSEQGRMFSLGSGFTDQQRRDPPPIGSVVTYRYRDLTNTGLPRFATFLRVHQE